MEWREILQPETLAMLIPIAGILVAGAIAITSMVIKHRERIAMIQQGMDPDTPKGKRGGASLGSVTAGRPAPGERMD
jgi:hypothetical protein